MLRFIHKPFENAFAFLRAVPPGNIYLWIQPIQSGLGAFEIYHVICIPIGLSASIRNYFSEGFINIAHSALSPE
jgi:hypothetical protein